jgi:hypothetical protein
LSKNFLLFLPFTALHKGVKQQKIKEKRGEKIFRSSAWS